MSSTDLAAAAAAQRESARAIQQRRIDKWERYTRINAAIRCFERHPRWYAAVPQEETVVAIRAVLQEAEEAGIAELWPAAFTDALVPTEFGFDIGEVRFDIGEVRSQGVRIKSSGKTVIAVRTARISPTAGSS